MSRPVTKLHEPKTSTTEDMTMCFWLGSEYEDKQPPQPLKDGVFLKEKDEEYVYVR